MSQPVILPPPKYTDSIEDCRAMDPPQCAQPMADIVHITGEGETFYLLTADQQAQLMRQIDQVETLMQRFRTILADALKPIPCQVIAGTGNPSTCACSDCRKRRWAEEADEAGLLALAEVKPVDQLRRIETAEDLQGRISRLKEQRDQFAGLCAWWNHENSPNCQIGANMPQVIDSVIEELQQALPASPKDSESRASDTLPSVEAGGRVRQHRGYTRASDQHGVVEIIVVSRPDRRYYISHHYASTLRTRYRITNGVLNAPRPLSDGDLRERGKQWLHQIRERVSSRLREDSGRPLGNLEAKLLSWTAKEDSALNALHREAVNWSSDQSDGAPYAVNADAHLLRFAAQASAGFSGFDPKQGEISIGVKAQASFALAEGKVSLEHYIPDQGGQDCFFAYRNADGQLIYHRFGAFRMKAALELSCFAGVTGTAAATASGKWKNTPSGASALLTSPELTSRGGAIKLQGSAFAGAQAGGSLMGALEWLPPEEQHRPDPSWAALLEVKGEGNVALGAGAGLDFQIVLRTGRLYFHLKAQVVLGPGASGGFGTMVNMEQAAGLIMVVYRNLSSIDYRYLLSIDERSFDLFTQVVTKAISTPMATIESVLRDGLKTTEEWWADRKQRIAAAQGLAARILEGRPLQVNGQQIAINELPPEVMGPALYILGVSYKLTSHEDRERAIIKLLRCVRTWRHFFLTLERVNQNGTRDSAMNGLDHIREFLSPIQKLEFSKFIDTLAASANQIPANTQLAITPWNFIRPDSKYEIMMAARENERRRNGPTMNA